jgi:hypothetical protein
VIAQLNSLGIEYALTGALAVSYYGRPRTTVDVDVIIKAEPKDFEKLAEAFRKVGLSCTVERLNNAWESKYRIATLEGKKGLRLDAILTQETVPRRKVTILGLPSYLQEPGPLVLQKLKLIKVTQDEERRFTDRMDVLSILRNAEVDVGSLRDLAGEQATLDLLDELLEQAEEPLQ